ncbi:unnamed protein product [Blepharisma stoltei]|uniref:Methylmalonyl Co-A mutase-associated GTPase MeaB n=1 Tax=Blepharisma stoltei TaxID=1481888 RepID=A0AAU9IZY6_9CILI|nr:unnamed protein product [Blepharisma stoltei]
MLTKDLLKGLLSGNRMSLSKSITLIESANLDHRKQATELLSELSPSPSSIRLGICGAPGAGKSTLIETLGLKFISHGMKPAVLAMDPSSVQFGGSILGDKTRMQELSAHLDAYVRPSPTKGVLGGVTSACSENIILCENAGYNPIIIETVGLGQSETTVDEVTDLILLVANPAGGDFLQGIKKGIMEVVDLVVVNKAEPPFREKAEMTKFELEQAFKMSVRRYDNWVPPVLLTSAKNKEGIEELVNEILNAKEKLKYEIFEKRKAQMILQTHRMMEDLLRAKLKEMKSSGDYNHILADLNQMKIIPRTAATQMLSLLAKD